MQGLGWGLHRGLDSGLMMMVSDTPALPAGGSSPVEVLAFFAILCANVSISLRAHAKARTNKIIKTRNSGDKGGGTTLTLLFPGSLLSPG